MQRRTAFTSAVEQWRAIRTEFEIVREAAYELAEHETHGQLLNKRGKKAGVDAYSLFIGNEARAFAYASEELIEHWRRHPRLTFAEFESQTSEAA